MPKNVTEIENKRMESIHHTISAPQKTIKRIKNKRLKVKRYLQQMYFANDYYPEYKKNHFKSTRKRQANTMMNTTHYQTPYREEYGKGQ